MLIPIKQEGPGSPGPVSYFTPAARATGSWLCNSASARTPAKSTFTAHEHAPSTKTALGDNQ